MASYKCPICEAKGVYCLTSEHGYEIYSCKNNDCNHFWHPDHKINQGIHLRNQDLEEESNSNLEIYGERNKRLLRLLKNNITRQKKYAFLDFGAGCAHISRTFKKELGDRVEIFCCEANTDCRKFYKEWGLTSVDSLKDIKIKIDCVYMIEVIEHIENPYKVISELKKLLSEKGRIFISTPPGYHVEEKTNAFQNPTHIHFFTDKSLNLLLRRCGMEDIVYKSFSEMYPKDKTRTIFFKIKLRTKILIKSCLKILKKIILRNNESKEIIQVYPFHLVGFTQVRED